MNYIKWATEILKLKPQNVLPVVLFMGFILIAPIKWLNTFGITTLVNNYRQWIAITFLASCALLISPVVLWIIRIVNNKISNFKFSKAGIAYLNGLTPDEKDILKFYIIQQKRTHDLDVRNGTVMGLVHANIIYQSSRLSDCMQFSFNIQPWAWDFLNNNRHLLGIIDEQMSKNI